MLPTLDIQERSTGPTLYESSIFAPSSTHINTIKQQFGPKTFAYLGKFADRHLYRSSSKLRGFTNCRQGAETEMNSSLRNAIRTVEHQIMVLNVISSHLHRFLSNKQKCINWNHPVPLRVESILAQLI